MKSRTEKIAMIAMFTSISLALYVIEGMIPVIIPIPGAKIGLSNIIIMFLVYKRKTKEAFLTLVFKIILSVFIAGGAVSAAFGFTGGLCALVIMILIAKLFGHGGEIPCSILAAMAHNFGQCLVALAMGMQGIALYLPYLMIIAVFTGTFNGIVCKLLNSKSSLNLL